MNIYKWGRLITILILIASLSACAGAGESLIPTPTSVPTPLETQTIISTPKPTFNPPACDLALPGSEDMMVLVCDSFDTSDNVLPNESQDNPYAKYEGKTVNGEYQLNYTAKNFAAFTRTAITWFDIANAQDFAASITGQMETQFQGISWGIGFRGSGQEEKDSFFLFSIYNDGTYAFEIYENNGWIPLISRRPSSTIVPDQPNKITVIAEGQNFSFFINDQAVNFFNGGTLEGLQIFLLVSVREGATVDYTFDDVVVQI